MGRKDPSGGNYHQEDDKQQDKRAVDVGKCCATCHNGYNTLALLDGVANTQIRLERVIKYCSDELAHDDDGSSSGERDPLSSYTLIVLLSASRLKLDPFYFF